jgi:mRNA interferase YafQ
MPRNSTPILLPWWPCWPADGELQARYKDHALVNTNGHRDCHIRPDLVLIYRRPDDESLELMRLGSHSELGLA